MTQPPDLNELAREVAESIIEDYAGITQEGLKSTILSALAKLAAEKDAAKGTVILLNRALPYRATGQLTGWSGVIYANSSFEEEHGAHVVRMTLEQWRACKDDIARGSVRRACQWEVDFVPLDSAALTIARAAIQSAPHDATCQNGLTASHCTCWKAKALEQMEVKS